MNTNSERLFTRNLRRMPCILLLAAGILVLTPPVWPAESHDEETVALQELPGAVRTTLQSELFGGEIGEIEKEIDDGKTVYEAGVTINGKEYEIHIAADGTLISKVLDDDNSEDDDNDNDEDGEDEAVWDFDKVNAGEFPAGWKAAETAGMGTPATWKVLKDDTAPSKPNLIALTETRNSGATFNLLVAEGTSYQDVEISLKLKAISGEEDQGGGPIWRAKDADNYYICRWNPLENNFRVYYVKDGRRRQIATANVETDPTKWHEIEIAMEGGKIEASFDGRKLIEVEDTTFPEAGMVGLWTKADAATAFDDLKVEEENK